jgi:hypothetical protein
MSHPISQSLQHRAALPDDATRHATLVRLAKSEAIRLHHEAVSEAASQVFAVFCRVGQHVWSSAQSTGAGVATCVHRLQSLLARHPSSRQSA